MRQPPSPKPQKPSPPSRGTAPSRNEARDSRFHLPSSVCERMKGLMATTATALPSRGVTAGASPLHQAVSANGSPQQPGIMQSALVGRAVAVQTPPGTRSVPALSRPSTATLMNKPATPGQSTKTSAKGKLRSSALNPARLESSRRARGSVRPPSPGDWSIKEAASAPTRKPSEHQDHAMHAVPTNVVPLRSSAALRSSARSSRSYSSPSVVHLPTEDIDLTPDLRQIIDGMARACDAMAASSTKTSQNGHGLRPTSSAFDVIKVLGEGSYADVYLVQRRGHAQDSKQLQRQSKSPPKSPPKPPPKSQQPKEGTQYALKMMTKSNLSSVVCEYLRVEAEVHSSIIHPFIVRMFGYFENEDHYAMLLEFAPGGDLHDLISTIPDFTLDVTRTRRYMAQVVSALDYLHHGRFGPAASIVHRDLKPENILVDTCQSRIMVADFGFAKTLRKGDGCYSFVGTPEYLAPEVVVGRGISKADKLTFGAYRYRYDKAVDWWGLGVMIFELLAGYVCTASFHVLRATMCSNAGAS